jgi:GDSL/SGNH-like Acyl-Esterase family found in Pmr5 and Cas1p
VGEFCRKLRGRGVLVVGDSISHQFYDALWMQLDAPGQPWEDMWHWVDDIKNPSRVQVCAGRGGGKVAYLRNDQVAVTDCVSLREKIKTTRPKHDWISVTSRFDVIVLSKGAHVVDDEGMFRRETEETARWVKKFVSGKPGREVSG